MATLCERKIKFSYLLVHLIGGDLAGDIEDDKNVWSLLAYHQQRQADFASGAVTSAACS
jgi:hypothetical protein